jgi:hypothetical protein
MVPRNMKPGARPVEENMKPGASADTVPAGGSIARTKKGRSGSQNGRGMRGDWARLTGHTVEVWLLGEHVTTGVVDQAAEDDSVLWIAGAGISTRRLFDKSTGYQVWV